MLHRQIGKNINYSNYFLIDEITKFMGDSVIQKSALSIPFVQKEAEAWVVNSIKARMIIKLDGLLEKEGRDNIRKLFLVPIFSISELSKRVETQAPEIKTLFYRELMETVARVKKDY